MNSDRRIFSPARRSRRCALTLVACSVLMIIAFVVIQRDRIPNSTEGPSVATSNEAPSPRKSTAPLNVSMAENPAPQAATISQ